MDEWIELEEVISSVLTMSFTGGSTGSHPVFHIILYGGGNLKMRTEYLHLET